MRGSATEDVQNSAWVVSQLAECQDSITQAFQDDLLNQLEVVICHGPALILLLDVNVKRCGDEVSEFSVVERSSEARGFHGRTKMVIEK